MIPVIPNQRQNKTNASKPFNDLVDYLEEGEDKEKTPQVTKTSEFESILNYAAATYDISSGKEKCIAVRTHGISKLANAAAEMNAISAENTRCKDPAFHFILSWHEFEHHTPEAMFDAAEHAIKSLGMADHQYVIAIHANTDNPHCHIAVNRIHPQTFKSHHIEWAQKTLHMAARQSEIKHGWVHDNGIYIVQIDGHDKKSIILNPDYNPARADKDHAHSQQLNETALPPWHDPESLESWLKTDVTHALKRALPRMNDWRALHTWLARSQIKLTDTGGGGMRLQAVSPETGETLDIPASKGLRPLKRSTLEARWGKFTAGNPEPDFQIPSFPTDIMPIDTDATKPDNTAGSDKTPCRVPDLTQLTQSQLTKGINHVLRTAPDRGIPPNPGHNFLHAEPDRRIPPTHRRGGLHELSSSSMDGDGPDRAMLLSDPLHVHMGDQQPRQDPNLRRSIPGSTESSRRSLTRDNSKREERKEQRAAARADLRQRFSQYRRFVRDGDSEYWQQMKTAQADLRQTLKEIRQQTTAAKREVRADRTRNVKERTQDMLLIDMESTRRQLQAESHHQTKQKALAATRQPPLGWREWLHEQSNLGDQAALSALRGIVYQAQRDAKHRSEAEAENEPDPAETPERKYRRLMERLLEEEKKEIAIRAANRNAMRPYEIDALLMRYKGIQWQVTGNGNIKYSDRDGWHLFTDRGNRVTFDRVQVSDEEIRLALVHAQQKFGKQLTLTGDDALFTARMARLADDMGMTILNPELQVTIANYRSEKALQIAPATPDQIQEPEQTQTPKQDTIQSTRSAKPIHPSKQPADQELHRKEIEEQIIVSTSTQDPELLAPALQTTEERLRAMVLAIDPRAEFTIPTTGSNAQYNGSVAVALDAEGNHLPGFVQRTGRGTYTLHMIAAPTDHENQILNVQYHNGKPAVTIAQHKGKGQGD